MNAEAKTIDHENAVVIQSEAPRDVATDTDPFVSMVERIVTDPSVPIERLERVLAMKERMEDRAREDEDRRARKAYFDAMAKCQAELPIVTKNRQNTHTRSTYADLAAIEAQAMPIIHKHGFATSFWPAGYSEKGEQRIKWRITHSAGHSESDIADIPVDNAGSQGKVNKTGTQAFGSTTSYGRRYLTCMLFNISTADNDGNRVDTGLLTADQIADLRSKIMDANADLPKFLDKFQIERIDDMPPGQFKRAMALLDAKIAKAAADLKAEEPAA